MSIDANEETGDLVRLTVRGQLTTADQAAFVGAASWKDDVFVFVAKGFRSTPTEYFTAEAPARAWLSA